MNEVQTNLLRRFAIETLRSATGINDTSFQTLQGANVQLGGIFSDIIDATQHIRADDRYCLFTEDAERLLGAQTAEDREFMDISDLAALVEHNRPRSEPLEAREFASMAEKRRVEAHIARKRAERGQGG